jgi:transcriptional regulator with XRE-family HTH domain
MSIQVVKLNVRNHRVLIGLTLKEIERKFGLPSSSVSRWEAKGAYPTVVKRYLDTVREKEMVSANADALVKLVQSLKKELNEERNKPWYKKLFKK